MTTRPLPVAIAMFASGHFAHQLAMIPLSVGASLLPRGVRGCLPGFVPVQSGAPQEH